MSRVTPLLGALVLAAVTLSTFWPVREHGFLNWDDGAVVAALEAPPAGSGRVAWAFTTRELQHVQPLAWLALDAVAGRPPSAARVHTAGVILHAVVVLVLFGVTASWLRGLVPAGDGGRWWIAAATTALFAVHPLRVEPVAWASALPYLLSYVPLLLSVWFWIVWARGGAPGWLAGAAVAFAASQLTRVTAPLAPLAFVAIAAADAGAVRRVAELARAAVLFLVVAVPLAVLEVNARPVESLADVALAPRLAAAVTAPGRYVWRTLAPIDLTPLDVLPRVAAVDWGPVAVAVLASLAVVALTWQLWSARIAAAVWGTYLLLLLPVSGLLPSGVQATADRYTYGPAMVLAVALAALLARAPSGARKAALLAAGASVALLIPATRTQAAYWRDSVTLWTRAVALDPGNDIALYNLALAEADAGRPEAAVEHLQRLVGLVPDHAPARARLAALVADREAAAGDRAAEDGQFHTAIAAYDRALDADPARVAVRVNRGMALVQVGRLDRGAADLESALAAGLPESPVVSALAFAWASGGRSADAVALLRRAHDARPDDAALAGNLARLLLTAEPPSLRDPVAALALVVPLNDRSGGRDPRVLALLAEALAATGRPRDAVETLTVAVNIATEGGDRALAAQLDARRLALTR